MQTLTSKLDLVLSGNTCPHTNSYTGKRKHTCMLHSKMCAHVDNEAGMDDAKQQEHKQEEKEEEEEEEVWQERGEREKQN